MQNFTLNGIEKDIEKITYSYVKVRSDTFTSFERDVEPFLMDYFSNIDYFKANPEHFGT